MKKISIGMSNFKEMIDKNHYYIDKSLFIKDIIEDTSKVILLPRPRRFGKTLNMSMLRCFFEKTEENNRYLFENLKINNYKDIMDKQGKYPMIYLTFKDVKNQKWENCYEKMQEIIVKEYYKHKYLIDNYLDGREEIYFKKILNMEATKSQYETSLENLSAFLSKYHKQKVVILIDEYDVPIQSGYLSNYYDEVIEFMRNFLSGGLKDNDHLEKGVLTGILRIARESIFSGLNNLEVCSILKNRYSNSFGFLEDEVYEMLEYYNLEFEMDEIKTWYNGYIFGENTIYNPWSILNYVKNHKDGFRPYWINTSSNDLVKITLTKGSHEVKKELEELIKGNELIKTINEDIVMKDIDKGTKNVWSFLLFSGYLKVVEKTLKEGELICKLKLPNLEVKFLYKQIVKEWFDENINNEKFSMMLSSLTTGDIKTFSKILKEFVLSSVSYFDVAGNESEKVYHAFVLGMLVALSDTHEVKSNKESGYGRYDVMIIPKDISKIGLVMEFKKVDKDDKEDLEIAAKEAIKQIGDKKYKQELLDRGITDIIEIGIAFEGKDLLVVY